MYEDILRQQVIVEIKNLIKKAEDIEEDKDLYCDFMKTVILRTAVFFIIIFMKIVEENQNFVWNWMTI